MSETKLEKIRQCREEIRDIIYESRPEGTINNPLLHRLANWAEKFSLAVEENEKEKS